jgi:hypothetical protein
LSSGSKSFPSASAGNLERRRRHRTPHRR